jgi:hypothetical protein
MAMEIANRGGGVNLVQLHLGRLPNAVKVLDTLAVRKVASPLVPEAQDHEETIRYVMRNVEGADCFARGSLARMQ